MSVSITDALNIFAILINSIALGIVIYQTHLNREALVKTQQAIDLERRASFLAHLPKANFIISVITELKKWRKELKKILAQLKAAQNHGKDPILKIIADNGLRSPAGIIDKNIYEICPVWLQALYETGAQHYYSTKVAVSCLWDRETDEPWLTVDQEIILRCEESINAIKELLKLINDLVPSAYLNAPATLRERDFF